MQKNNLVRDGDGWETVSSKINFKSSHLTVATDEVRTPTRSKPREWSTVHRKPAVVIAPITSTGKFILIREERIPIRRTIWSFPAGQIDDSLEPDETKVRSVAEKELREETGYELSPDGEMISLGYFFTSPGLTDEHCYLFLARPVQKSAAGSQHDEGEAIVDCREFSSDVLRQMIASGEVCDSNTLSIWARMMARGDLFP
ncbi:MAG TPA: NUDIX hydrolase [Chthoniobacterales bacterium]|nr:NUDIX hydrolase [Chthoniobacterales bacterium]